MKVKVTMIIPEELILTKHNRERVVRVLLEGFLSARYGIRVEKVKRGE